MKCPNDGATLLMTDRQGVEIDYCPECRGVWLDRGELDKLIEKSAASGGGQAAPAPQHVQDQPRRNDEYKERQEFREQRPQYHDDDYKEDYKGEYGHHGKKHKKESFLGDLFDF